MPEQTPISSLPGRMAYWTPSLAEEEGPRATGEGGDKSPMQRKDEEPTAPPMAPEDLDEPSERQRGEDSRNLLFTEWRQWIEWRQTIGTPRG